MALYAIPTTCLIVDSEFGAHIDWWTSLIQNQLDAQG